MIRAILRHLEIRWTGVVVCVALASWVAALMPALLPQLLGGMATGLAFRVAQAADDVGARP